MPPGSHTRPLLLGHRGCRLPGFRENSLRAFQYAIESGCDGFEFDIRLTADGRCLCVHDASVGATAISKTAYEEITKQHMTGSSQPDSGFCCLEDVLDAFADSAFLDIEIKVSGSERDVLRLLKRRKPSRSYFVSSFLPEVLCRLDELAGQVLGEGLELGYIFDDSAGLSAWPRLPGPWVIPRHGLVTRDFVQAVHASGRKVATWTVNSPLEMVRLAEWGVDAIVSDDPVALSRAILG